MDLQIIYKRLNLTWTWRLSIAKSFEGQYYLTYFSEKYL